MSRRPAVAPPAGAQLYEDGGLPHSSSPDEDSLEFARAHRRRRLRLALVLGAVILGPLAWLVLDQAQVAAHKRDARLTAGHKAELSALLDRREAVARDSVARWNEGVQREALAALTFGTAECPLKLKPPSQGSAAAYVKYGTHDMAFGAWSLCILRSAGDAPSCARTWVVPAEHTLLRARLEADDVYSWDLQKERSAPPEAEPASVVVVVRVEVRPVVHSPSVGRVTFSPGTLTGGSFLYSPEAGRFICGAEVSVRNSKNVDIEYGNFGEAAEAQQRQAEYETRSALERDLELHLRFAVTRLRGLTEPTDGGD